MELDRQKMFGFVAALLLFAVHPRIFGAYNHYEQFVVVVFVPSSLYFQI